MSMAEDEEVGGLELDEDEFEHTTLIPEPVRIKLRLSNDGAKWILVAVKDAGPRYGVGTPEFLKLRALARGANLVRFASIGLTLGYYGGAIATIRPVYESLLYAYLFDRYPMQATSWVRLALDSSLEEPEAREEERRLWDLAKRAFNGETGERDLGRTIWEETCKFIHHTLEGVAAECGLEPGQVVKSTAGQAYLVLLI